MAAKKGRTASGRFTKGSRAAKLAARKATGRRTRRTRRALV